MKRLCSAILFLCPLLASAQLAVFVSPLKVTGSKAVVLMAMKNKFAEKVESARATVFLLDSQGTIIGQSVKWVIGGNSKLRGLSAGGTNSFNFVVPLTNPISANNVQTKVTFNRMVLEGGKVVDVNRNVEMKP